MSIDAARSARLIVTFKTKRASAQSAERRDWRLPVLLGDGHAPILVVPLLVMLPQKQACIAWRGTTATTLAPVAKVEREGALSPELLREFFREMLLIRRFEEKVEERFRAGELPEFPSRRDRPGGGRRGDRRALEEGDVIASTHRAHGHTLAKGNPPEQTHGLYGKIEGCSHGYGGSMRLYDVEREDLGADAVVGGGLPAIVGAALAFKFRDEPEVAVAFFGDGATTSAPSTRRSTSPSSGTSRPCSSASTTTGRSPLRPSSTCRSRT